MQQVACRRGFLAQLRYLHELTHYLENLDATMLSNQKRSANPHDVFLAKGHF